MKITKYFIRILSTVLVTALIISVFAVSSVSALTKQPYTQDIAPVNPNANTVCRNFYQYLCNVGKSNSVLSGAFSYRFSGVDATGNNDGENPENDYYKHLKNIFGVTPVIMGSLLQSDYIPVIAQRYKQGAIPMMQVKIHSETASALSDVSDVVKNFDLTNKKRNMTMYNEYRANLEALGKQLKTLEESGVDVYIVRPWIEMNNSSEHGAWGKTKEGCKAFQNMWRQAVDYLVNEVKLTGILFAYAPMGYAESRNFYPGSEYVDINAPTVYANSSDGEVYETDCKDYSWMRLENRPFAFSETAARTGLGNWMVAPVGDYKTFIESVLYCFPEISFIDLWFMDAMSLESAGSSTTLGNYNGEYLIRHPQVIVAEETVDYKKAKKIEPIRTATFYKDKNAKGSFVSLYEGSYNALDFKKNGIMLSDIKSLDVMQGCAVEVFSSSNCTGSPRIYFGKTVNIGDVFAKANSVKIVRLENIAKNKDIWADNDDKNIFRLNDGVLNRCVTEAANADGSLNITIDLGAEYTVGQISIDNASFYEDSVYNMRDFEIFVSADDNTYKSVYKAVGNTLPCSDIYFCASNVRYIKLKVITPNNSASEVEKNRVSVADISVYGLKGSFSTFNSIPDNVTENNDFAGGNDIARTDDIVYEPGKPSSSYGDENVISQDAEKQSLNNKDDEKPTQYVIPSFYNYVWLIICAGILLIAGIVWTVLLICSHKKGVKK